jgi:hypothetical protein
MNTEYIEQRIAYCETFTVRQELIDLCREKGFEDLDPRIDKHYFFARGYIIHIDYPEYTDAFYNKKNLPLTDILELVKKIDKVEYKKPPKRLIQAFS